MKIVIIGSGKIGETLAEQLLEEGHDIVVVDKDQNVVENLANELDIMGLCGNGTNHQVQLEAGVNKADIVIACTNLDEVNMFACLMAKKLGAKYTIARIRNPEYSDQLIFMQNELKLSLAINPEYSTALECFRIIRFPAAMHLETFSDGFVDLVDIKIANDSPICGMKLMDMRHKYKAKVLVCVVQRGDEVFIPDGAFELKAGDKISVTGTPVDVEQFFSAVGIKRKKVQNVMIVGGGKIAYYLSRMLIHIGIKVKIVDSSYEHCQRLADALPKALIIHGDGSDHEILQEEGLENQDAFAMLTGFDEENMIVSMYAASRKVPKVLTKINSASLIRLAENMDNMDTVISPRQITANRIISYVRGINNSLGSNVITMHKMVGGKVEALEFKVGRNFEKLNVPLKDLRIKKDTLIVSITRGKTAIAPGGNDAFCLNDKVIVVTMNKKVEDLSDIFA